MSDQPSINRTDPDEVFGLLANETRVGILQALWEHSTEPLPFSDLHDAVDVRDSGQFNYHLGQLVGEFVARTEDGYELTQAGKMINGAIEAGAYTGEADIEPIPLDDPCPSCGGARTFTYEDEIVRVECGDCPVAFTFFAPPGIFAGYDRAGIPDVADRYLRSTLSHTAWGFCCLCDGHVEPTAGPMSTLDDVPAEARSAVEDGADEIPMVTYHCDRCSQVVTSSLDVALLEHPAVVSFHDDHGVDVRDQSVWDVAQLAPDRASVTATDPFRGDVTYAIDGETLTLTVDATLEVVAIEP